MRVCTIPITKNAKAIVIKTEKPQGDDCGISPLGALRLVAPTDSLTTAVRDCRHAYNTVDSEPSRNHLRPNANKSFENFILTDVSYRSVSFVFSFSSRE